MFLCMYLFFVQKGEVTILFPYCTDLTGRGKASSIFQHFNPGTTERHYQKWISLFVSVHLITFPLCMTGTVRWLLLSPSSFKGCHPFSSELNRIQPSISSGLAERGSLWKQNNYTHAFFKGKGAAQFALLKWPLRQRGPLSISEWWF